MRTKILFNDCWRFHRGDIEIPTPLDKGPLYVQAKTERYRMGPASIYFIDQPDSYQLDRCFPNEQWEFVRLPHDYVIKGTPAATNNNTRGYLEYPNAWYRKHFTLPAEDAGKRIVLQFDGVSCNCTVYLNGCLLKHNFCGYTSFDVDITDFVNLGGENVVAVYVDCRESEGWWYEGGGIYRSVWLLKTDEIAVDTDGVYVLPTKGDDGVWSIDIETTVVSIARKPRTVGLRTELIDAEGNVVAVAEGKAEVGPHDKAVAKYSASVTDPHLWDVDDPYLYGVRTTVESDGEIIDEHTTRTGFRYFHCDPERGFFLNGRHLVIKGVCGHEDCGLLGKAVPENVHKYKMGMLKEMGVNGYRTSHYQQHSAILDACDELGFIVLDEARWFSSNEESIAQLETLVRRDRNRPSVFFWSLSNEEYTHLTEQGRRITNTLMDVLKRLDGVRPVTSAIDKSPNVATVCDELDIIGINYNLGALFDEVHEKYPEKAIFSSENCATSSTRGWYHPTCNERGYLSAYDQSMDSWFTGREFTWNYLTERPWVMGGYQWDGFEHRGETFWPRLCSQAGAIDLYLQRKDAFYQNQSHWSDKPMVHLLPHWNVDVFDGEPVNVWAYTNCEEVELILNGRSFGKTEVTKYRHLEWSVDYEPGRLEAIGYIGGEAVARDLTETAGAPVQLVLKLENSVSSVDDVAILTCYTVDAEGRYVPTADPYVEFSTTPNARILGTGSDVCDHVALPEPKRQMRAGRIGLAVGFGVDHWTGNVTRGNGVVEIYAKASGLRSARVRFKIED